MHWLVQQKIAQQFVIGRMVKQGMRILCCSSGVVWVRFNATPCGITKGEAPAPPIHQPGFVESRTPMSPSKLCDPIFDRVLFMRGIEILCTVATCNLFSMIQPNPPGLWNAAQLVKEAFTC